MLSPTKKLPFSPGVYLFVNKKGGILYIGRATSLRRRVANYFRKNIGPRIGEMVNLATKIKHYKTETVLEAIILEAKLIKKYWPKYNIREKDDRSFIYIIIPKGDYPHPMIVRGHELSTLNFKLSTPRLFGPYQSLNLVQNALKIIRRVFPYSTCVPFNGKPCFDYQIGLCPGLCVGKISKKEYAQNIKNIIFLLSGEKKKLLKKLAKENPEKAKALKHIGEAALLSREDDSAPAPFRRIEGYDISHLTGKETVGSMVVFTNGEADKTQYRLFKIKEAPANDDLRALQEVITRRFNHQEWPSPDLIMIDGGKPQIDFIKNTLRELKMIIPIVGISKYGGDQLVFPKELSQSTQKIITSQKNILLQVREEAHRFAISFSRRRRTKSYKL